MRAEELRIGNLVTDNWGSSIYEVDSINSKGINLFVEDDGNWSELAKTWVGAEYEFEDIKGIELTGDWLIKFGFEQVREYYTIDNDFDIFTNKIGYYCHINSGNLYIKTVHQLQNLYYALIGEELIYES